MKAFLKILGFLLLAVLLLGAGGYLWASVTTSRTLARTFDSHSVDFPVPFPLPESERLALGLSDEEAHAVAIERARERGRHLVEARYACAECHGSDFGGGVMVDAPPIGRILGPNLTSGNGSRIQGYSPADWDRIVRHGILPDGRPTAMPSEDFELMSDQELSDIIVYLESRPPVDNVVPPVTLGPLGKVLVATRQIRFSADLIASHDAPHAELPPPAEVTVEFGRHLGATCTGCHGHDLSGGPIVGGDPSWVPARNLTPDSSGLAAWTYDDFVTAMRGARRPDGTPIQLPMTMVTPFAERMTEIEMEALWVYLQSLPPVATTQ